MAPALIVTIVRHAETEENRLRVVQGQLDTKLSDAGRKQAEVVAAALAAPEVPFSHAFSSDLSRSVETAEAILRYHPHLRLEKQEILRERSCGSAEGKPWTGPVPDMESFDALKARTLQWWISTITPLITIGPESDGSDRPWHVLVVGHGAFIRTLVLALIDHDRGLLSVEPGTQVGKCFNTSVTTFHLESPIQGTLVRYGDIAHFFREASNAVNARP